jgi:hypothetical protein
MGMKYAIVYQGGIANVFEQVLARLKAQGYFKVAAAVAKAVGK